jgi:hypothetical protein
MSPTETIVGTEDTWQKATAKLAKTANFMLEEL